MYHTLKRILDIIIASFALLLLLPFFIIVSIVLSVTGEREVFYRQNRIGLKNQNFKILKFATMMKNSMNIGTGSITLRNDPRVTSFGKYLRMTKVNELPQILNVLAGEMSIVGPRPLVTSTFDAYPSEIRYKVYDSVPGITGVGSIIFRDEEKLISGSGMEPSAYYKQYIAPHKGALEIWYNSNKSLWVDLKLIFLTAWVILFPESNLIYKWFPSLPQKQF
ncbi:MAG: sugar transferase [Bacteroidota bacterium]|nr:sugar transferase [Bacteroidota bacterium]